MREFERGAGPIAARLRAGITKLALALRIEGNRGIEAFGLSPLQAQILGLLAASSKGMRLTDLAAASGVRLATASEAVKTLSEKRLVSRRRSARDRRSVEIAPTATGRELASRSAAGLPALDRCLTRMPGSEQEALLKAIATVIGELVATGNLPTQRICPDCRFFRPNAHPGARRPHHCAFADLAFADRTIRFDCPDFVALERGGSSIE